MLEYLEPPNHTVFTISDFIGWAKNGELDLSPDFQRNPIWQGKGKSFLIDTLLRGLPIPVIFLREVTDIKTFITIKQVVDGQQRLRTVFTYINKSLLKDYDPAKDDFSILKSQNPDFAGMTFGELPPLVQQRILNYRINVVVLPNGTEDSMVFEIFSRLNSTGEKLNHPELLNAAYYGAFRRQVYQSAYSQTDRFLKWGLLNNKLISRMKDRELVSDIFSLMISGVSGRSNTILENLYDEYDDDFPQNQIIDKRFNHIMEYIDKKIGEKFKKGKLAKGTWFYPIFAALYSESYGLGSKLDKTPAKKINLNLSGFFDWANEIFSRKRDDIPDEILSKVKGQITNKSTREKLIKFIQDNS